MDDPESTKRFVRHVDIGRTLEMLGIAASLEGRQWKASCPNAVLGHSGADAHPSWAIRDDVNHDSHGVHACWSCDYAGNIVTLVQDVLGLKSYKEARAWLQTHAMKGQTFAPLSVTVEIIDPAPTPILRPPEGVRFGRLVEWDAPYRDYWMRRRGFSSLDAQEWRVGYAPSGICEGRIWIPLYNEAGYLVNWTARSIDDREPRYLRASSALNPDKGAIFGEAKWGEFGRNLVAVMEGELNAMRVASVFRCPVGALGGGSKLHPTHAIKLASFDRFVVFADGDAVGDNLTRRLRDLGRPMDVLRFSNPWDPCSIPMAELIEYGKQAGLVHG